MINITVYSWANVVKNDTIVVFDETNTAENGGEVRTITADPIDNGDGTMMLTLNAALGKHYYATSHDSSQPPQPTFTNGHCAGIGVIHSADGQITDTNPNQINGPGSAFYDADMRQIEQPYDDAYVEFLAPRVRVWGPFPTSTSSRSQPEACSMPFKRYGFQIQARTTIYT